MQRFTNILVYHDTEAEHTTALRRAAQLAVKTNGRMTIASTVQSAPAFISDLVPVMKSLDRKTVEACRGKLETLAKQIHDEFGLTPSVEVLQGRPITELVRRVDSGNYDLLMKDARATTPELFFGSLDMRLLRYCPVPLWLTRPDAPTKTNRVLVAIDPLVDPNTEGVNRQIAKMASLLAYRDRSELHVVAVWQTPFDSLATDDEYKEQFAKFTKTLESAAKSGLNRILTSSVTAVKPEKVHLRSGNDAEEIVSVVDSLQPDTLVIGSLARAGIAGVLIGNTAEKVFRLTKCSVLTVKPDGFHSPILN